MAPKSSSCHQCLELHPHSAKHYLPSAINLQAFSSFQASSVENPPQYKLLSCSVTDTLF